MSERIEWELNPSQNTGIATVTSSRLSPEDIDASTIGDVSFSFPGGSTFSSIFDAFKNIDPLAAAALLGIPAIVKALGAGGSGAAASSAIPTTTPPPGTTTPPPATTTPPPVTTTPPPGTTTPPPGTTTPPPTTDTTTTSTSPNPTEDELIRAGIPRELLPLLLKYGLGALASYLSYKSAKDAQEQAKGVSFTSRGPVTSTRRAYQGSTYKPAAQGGLMTLAGGGGVSSLTPVVDNPTAYMNDVSNALLTMQEGRLRDPKLYDAALSGLDLRNADKLFGEIARNPDELNDRDYYLMEAFGLPALASMPPSDSLVSAVDRIRGLLDSSSTPTPSQISMYEANELYAPGGQGVFDSGSAALSPSKDYGNAFSEEYNPTLEKMMREFEKTGRISGVDNAAEDEELGSSYSKMAQLLSPKMGKEVIQTKAAGGLTSAKQPFYLGGPTDGMADEVPAHIDNKRPAALSDGEFVIPADVVSHLGNGNSNAGASRLYEMMDRVREARTGNSKQGIQINPNKFMPR